MTDITIHLRDAGERWVIQLDGPDDHYEVEIEPLSVEIPSTVRDLSDDARTWDRLPDHFAPTLDTIQPGLPVLKDLGSYLQRTLLGHAEFARRLTAQRQSAPEHRLLFETGDHGLLRQLPLELLFDDDRQQFLKREPGLVSVRTIRNAKWQWLELPKRARVVIATAHSDSEPRPTADELAAHANALADEITKLGWEPIAIPNATAESLRAAVRDGVDLLYVACHGQPDEDHAGRLHLRDRTVSGSELGEWIDDANATITAVLLCACSTAVPGRSGNTHGMAEYLARKVTAALGFRAPVSVSWALSFTQRTATPLTPRSVRRAAAAMAAIPSGRCHCSTPAARRSVVLASPASHPAVPHRHSSAHDSRNSRGLTSPVEHPRSPDSVGSSIIRARPS
jgi:hypothetical protein